MAPSAESAGDPLVEPAPESLPEPSSGIFLALDSIPDLTGLILAGGRSRRFGADKALAVFAGETLIEWVFRALEPLCAAVLVASGGEPRTFGLGSDRVVPVVDRIAGHGPLSGLEAGLSAALTPWVLAVACDLPFLTQEALGRLVAARKEASEGPEGEEVIAGCGSDDRPQPLCALYRRSVLTTIRRRLDTGELALKDLLAELTVRTVRLPDGALANVNTPADLISPQT